MTANEPRFSVRAVDGYVHLKTWGPLDINDLEAPVSAAMALAADQKLDCLLDDIREIDTSGVSIPIQTKSMGILWKLRSFRKVAIIMKGGRLRLLLFGALEALRLDDASTFKSFDNEAEAIAWLKEDS